MAAGRMFARLAAVPLLGVAGLTVPTAIVPEAAQAAGAAQLYVSNRWCAPNGPQNGSPSAPFCTIQAASDVAGPGQTVLVQPGVYRENVSFTRSGTASAPITFRAVPRPDEPVRVGKYDTAASMGVIMLVYGAHDVVLEGFDVYGESRADSVAVTDSSRVTLDQLTVHGARDGSTGVNVNGVSDDVTISRSVITNPGDAAVDLDPGATNVTVTGNQLIGSGLLATISPGLTVTGNTVVTDCKVGIDLYAGSTGASVRNNIIRTSQTRQPCADPARASAIRVDSNSVTDTGVDHNLIDPAGGGPLYTWRSEAYDTSASFVGATGQGAHDLVADPLIGMVQAGWSSWYETRAGSPARDSADATARGSLDTDLLDNSYADDPAVANTGTGSGYRDRGAVEAQGSPVTDPAYLRRKVGGGPFDVVAGGGLRTSWTVERQRTKYAYQFSSSPYWEVTDADSVAYTARRAGSVCVKVSATLSNFRRSGPYDANPCTVVGARFTPVAPTRLLDTRSGLGSGSALPVPPNGSVTLPINPIGGVPARDITALVFNVTVTQPTASGFVTVHPPGEKPTASNVNFVAGETVPNQVTTLIDNGYVTFSHTGPGTVHLVADLQGFYSGGGGSGFAPTAPVRALDTRVGTAGPIPADTTRTLDLSAKLPADATAAVLNVTVADPTARGVLTLFPYGAAAPVASHLNFVAGQDIPNLVTVPVANGKVSIRNASAGSTHVIADLAGWFSPTATQTFVPLAPTRLLDTRTGLGTGGGPVPVGPRGTAHLEALTVPVTCAPACPSPTALVGNLTVVSPTAPGVLIAYPRAQQRPNASNVNFVTGETASNAAVVAVNYGVDLYNSSAGSVHLVADQSGYFIPAAS